MRDEIDEQKIEALLTNPREESDYTHKNGLLNHKGKFYAGSGGQVRTKLIKNIHLSQNGGYSSIQASIYKAKQHFFLAWDYQ